MNHSHSGCTTLSGQHRGEVSLVYSSAVLDVRTGRPIDVSDDRWDHRSFRRLTHELLSTVPRKPIQECCWVDRWLSVAWFADRREMVNVRICRFENSTVTKRAGGDDQIDRGDCGVARRGPTGQVITWLPRNLINRQLWNRPCKLSLDRPFCTPASAVPEFELHRRAPACLPGGQRSRHASCNRLIRHRDCRTSSVSIRNCTFATAGIQSSRGEVDTSGAVLRAVRIVGPVVA